jgi:hypothetical protein
MYVNICQSMCIPHDFVVPDTDQDVEKLIEKTEKEGDKEETANEGGLSFSFAKIWAADKDSLEEVEDDDQGDSWAQTLQKITAERKKAQIQEVALSGRGVARAARRVAAVPKVPAPVIILSFGKSNTPI